MSKKPETTFKEWVRAKLERLPNTKVFKIQQVGIRGSPDFLMCVNGHFVAMELKKSDKEEPAALQTWNLNCVTNAGGISVVCYPENWAAVWQCLKEIAGKSESGLNIKQETSH